MRPTFDTYAMGAFERICICGGICVVLVGVYAAASLNEGDIILQIVDGKLDPNILQTFPNYNKYMSLSQGLQNVQYTSYCLTGWT